MASYGAVVDQQAGREGGESTSLSGGSILLVVLVFAAAVVVLAHLAQKKAWVMPGLFLVVFVVWPVCAILSR